MTRIDLLFQIAFARYVDHWTDHWTAMLHVLHPDTVVRGHGEGFRRSWARKSRRVGYLSIEGGLRAHIRMMQM